jgi:hypothetical protein
LTVGGDLYLNGKAITTLPKNLSVGGDLDLSGTPSKRSRKGSRSVAKSTG